MVSVPLRNPRRLIRGDQITLQQLKIYIEKSKDKVFFIRQKSAESTQDILYLIKVDLE